VKRLVLLAVAALLLAGCQRASTTRETVMVYTPFPVGTAEGLASAFEKKTGIKVEQIKEGTTRVYSRLRAEKGFPRADVWIGGGGMVPFITAANEGLLEPYVPKGLENLPATRGNLVLRDVEWRWVGAAIIALGYAYNPEKMSESELPKKWEDLADPKWKGEIMMWDPAASGTAMLFLQAALLRSRQETGNDEAGWKFLKAFYANMKRYAEEGPPSLMVSRGEIKIGIHFEHQVLQSLQENKDPQVVQEKMRTLRWTLPPGSPVIVDPIALVKNAPHSENGKKYIDFVMSPEGQAIINEYFFVLDSSFGPPKYLDYTLADLSARAMAMDVDWMGKSFNPIRTHWQNEVEKSHWLWEGARQ